MIRHIIIHEIKEYIKTKKFLIGLLLTSGLFIACVVINMMNYQENQRNYLDSLITFRGFADEYSIHMPPNVLDIWVQGVTSQLGNRVGLKTDSIPTRTTGDMGAMSHRFFLPQTNSFDVLFIVKFILSLFVILLAHNCISGEMESGTLRMVLSNNVSRYAILIGKYIGGLLIVVYSLAIAFTISLIVVIINPNVDVTMYDIARLGLLFGASIMYLCTFYSLGILISVVTNKPLKSLMWLLEIWIFLVIVYPNISMMMVKKYYLVQNETEISDYIKQITQRYDDEISMNEKDNSISLTDKSRNRVLLHAEKTEKLYQIDMEYNRNLDTQVNAAYYYSSLSPAVVFDQIMYRSANNGIANYNHFIDSVYEYWRENIRYSEYNAATAQSSLPEFTYRPLGLADTVSTMVFDYLYLFLIMVVCYVLAQIQFQRMEVY